MITVRPEEITRKSLKIEIRGEGGELEDIAYLTWTLFFRVPGSHKLIRIGKTHREAKRSARGIYCAAFQVPSKVKDGHYLIRWHMEDGEVPLISFDQHFRVLKGE